MQNIQDFKGKIKSLFLDDTVFFGVLILLVGLTAFGLGRIAPSGQEGQPATIIMTQSDGREENGTERYVGSKNSDKYHLPWCSGAERISEENKIWFDSQADAEAAGYVPAENCPEIE